jgi:hypothetical protein
LFLSAGGLSKKERKMKNEQGTMKNKAKIIKTKLPGFWNCPGKDHLFFFWKKRRF